MPAPACLVAAAVARALTCAAPVYAWETTNNQGGNGYGGHADAVAQASAEATAIAKGGHGGNVDSVIKNDVTNVLKGGDVTAKGGHGGKGGAGGNANQHQGQGQDQNQHQVANGGKATANNQGVNNSTNIKFEDRLQAPGMGAAIGSSAGCDVFAFGFSVPGIGLQAGIPSNAFCKQQRDTAVAIYNGQGLNNCYGACAAYVASVNPDACRALEAAGSVICAPRGKHVSQKAVVMAAEQQSGLMTGAVFAGLSKSQQRAFCGGQSIMADGLTYMLAAGGSCRRQ